MKNNKQHPHLGFGLGLRIPHYAHIFEQKPKVDWFEIISENFMESEGRPRANLARIRADYPVVMHGVSMSIGTVDPLDSDYLAKLKRLIEWVEPAWISDHLCWTGIAHKNTHDLLPVPYTRQALDHIVSRIGAVQDFLGMPIALENPSTYLEFKGSDIPEAEFIAEMAKRSGCNLLLDVNNVFVSCFNHRLDPKAYLDALPLDKVIQIHLSGHSNYGTHIVDTHDNHVVDEVWALYQYAVARMGRTPNTMVEWDDNIPAFPVLMAELDKAKRAAAEAHTQVKLPDLLVEGERYVANQPLILRDAQSRMQEAILQGAGEQNVAHEWIRAKENFSPAEQLHVYQNAYRARLYSVTAEDYAVLKTYLGDETFDQLLTDFVEQVPSEHFNLARYTARFPDYLRDHADAFANELGLLEAAICRMADPAESEPLTLDAFTGLGPEQLLAMRLTPRSALELFSFHYPVNAYFEAVMQGETPAAPSLEHTYLAVFRHENTVWRMPLSATEYQVLQQLFAGKNIGDALEEAGGDAANNIGEWLPRWVRNGLLAEAVENIRHVA